MKNEYIEYTKGCWLRRDEIKGFKIAYERESDKYKLCMLIPSGIDRGCCSREVFTWELFNEYEKYELAEIAMKYLLKNKRIDNETAILLQIVENNETLASDEKQLLKKFMFAYDDTGDYVYYEQTSEIKELLFEVVGEHITCNCKNIEQYIEIAYNNLVELWNEVDSAYKKLETEEE